MWQNAERALTEMVLFYGELYSWIASFSRMADYAAMRRMMPNYQSRIHSYTSYCQRPIRRHIELTRTDGGYIESVYWKRFSVGCEW